VVRSFDVGALGKSFTFSMTGKVRNMQARSNTVPAIVVPVSFGAGSN